MDSVISFLAEYGLAAITFIVIFSLLIILHECGHFWAARAAKVKVLEFGFGLPPKVWGKKTSKKIKYQDKNGKIFEEQTAMEWTLNAIPFGGFVRMLGEEEKSNDPGAFGQRPLLWRMLVVAGGVIMNFLLGWIIFSIAFTIGLNPMMPTPEQREQYTEQGIFEKKETVVISNIKDSALANLGVQEFDTIISLDGKAVDSAATFEAYYVNALRNNKKTVPLTIERFNLKNRSFDQHTYNLPIEVTSPFAISKTHIEITQVLDDSPAAFARLQQGDHVVSIEGNTVHDATQLIASIALQASKGKKQIRLGIIREEKEMVYIVKIGEDGKLGIALNNTEDTIEEDKILVAKHLFYYPVQPVQYPWYEASRVAYNESLLWMERTWDMLKGLVVKVFTQLELPAEAGGPIAIADTTHSLTQLGDFSKILQFAAILSLSLAIVNMMPFPGLDGGRFIFLLFEGVLTLIALPLRWMGIKKFPKKVPDSWEIPFHMIGYGMLLILIVWISFNDVVRIFFS